jgi:hypothetical protein
MRVAHLVQVAWQPSAKVLLEAPRKNSLQARVKTPRVRITQGMPILLTYLISANFFFRYSSYSFFRAGSLGLG